MKLYKKLGALFLIVVTLSLSLSMVGKVFAGTLTGSSVLETGGASNVNPMIEGDGQSLAINFTTANSTSGTTTVTLTFTGWTGGSSGSVNSSQTAPTAGGCTTLFPGSPTALPGSLTAAGSGAVLTISGVTALSATTDYCTTLPSASAVTNPTATGDYSVAIATASDSQTVGIDVLSSGVNAYSITGTIAPTFTMSLSGSTDSFSGNLSASAVTLSSGITTTINTNAKSGWFVWAEDSNAGLKSTQASHTINSVATGSNYDFSSHTGSDEYGLGVSADNTTNYAYGGGTTGSGLSTSTFNEIAASSSTASNVTFVSRELADISATSPPATDYTDAITLIGAGSF